MLPRFLNVRPLEIVNRELQLILKPNLAVFNGAAIWVDDPGDVVNAINILEESRDAFQTVGQLSGNGIEIDAAALLEVGELGDLQAIEHHLPTDAPCAQRG